MTQYWQSVLVDRSQKYRYLRYLIIPDSNTPCLHGCWDTGKFDTLSNKRATTKVKLLTGTYILLGNRSVYNQHSVNATCPLCNSADETRHHFLIECSALSDLRRPYMERLLQYANDVNYSTDDLAAPVLNPSETLRARDQTSDGLRPSELEIMTQHLIYRLHSKRHQLHISLCLQRHSYQVPEISNHHFLEACDSRILINHYIKILVHHNVVIYNDPPIFDM